MRIAVLDDEQYALDNLTYLLAQFPSAQLVHQSADPQETLRFFCKEGADVLFLDISMPEINGIDLARQIRVLCPRVRIVFTTAYANYALDAFGVDAVDYILKPATYVKIKRALDKLGDAARAPAADEPKEDKQGEPLLITGNKKGKYYVIKDCDAQYIYVEQRKLLLVADGEQYVLKNNLEYWEKRLKDRGWFRCHRAFLISIQQIESTFPVSNSVYYVLMKNSSYEIPVSRSYITSFRKLLDL